MILGGLTIRNLYIACLLLVVLAGCSEKKPLNQIRLEELSSSDSAVRRKAVGHFAASSTLPKETIVPIIKLLVEDPEKDIRRWAGVALLQIEEETADPVTLHRIRVGVNKARSQDREPTVIIELDKLINKFGHPDPNYKPPPEKPEGEEPAE